MNNDIDLHKDSFEDIEQILSPQCEFHASEKLRNKVLARARKEAKPRRIVELWPWLAAASVAGVLFLLLTPQKQTNEHLTKDQKVVAKADLTTIKEREQTETMLEQELDNEVVEKPQPIVFPQKKSAPLISAHHQEIAEAVAEKEPVQMSDETRSELYLATLNLRSSYLSPLEELEKASLSAQTRAGGMNEYINKGSIEFNVPCEYGNFLIIIQHGSGILGDINSIPIIEEQSATKPEKLPQGIQIDSVRVNAQILASGFVDATVYFSIYKPLEEDSCGWIHEERFKHLKVL